MSDVPDHYLYMHLSLTDSPSLANRMTRRGGARNRAIAHLKSLGLQRLIDTSGAGQLGDAVRTHLRAMFGIQTADKLPDDGDDSDGSDGSEDGMEDVSYEEEASRTR